METQQQWLINAYNTLISVPGLPEYKPATSTDSVVEINSAITNVINQIQTLQAKNKTFETYTTQELNNIIRWSTIVLDQQEIEDDEYGTMSEEFENYYMKSVNNLLLPEEIRTIEDFRVTAQRLLDKKMLIAHEADMSPDDIRQEINDINNLLQGNYEFIINDKYEVYFNKILSAAEIDELETYKAKLQAKLPDELPVKPGMIRLEGRSDDISISELTTELNTINMILGNHQGLRTSLVGIPMPYRHYFIFDEDNDMYQLRFLSEYDRNDLRSDKDRHEVALIAYNVGV